MSKRSVFAAAIVAIVAAGSMPAALAADDAFCKDYARAAVNQVHSADKHRRCEGFIRANEARW